MPTIVPLFNDKPIEQVHAGRHFTMVHLQNGQVYAFGHVRCCGSHNDSHTIAPVQVQLPGNALVKSIRCASYSTVIQTVNDQWYGFGQNSQFMPAYGKPVHGDPTRIDDLFPMSSKTKQRVQVHKLVADSYNFYMWTMEGELYILGMNMFGNFGLGNETAVPTWTLHPTLHNIVDIQTSASNAFIFAKK